MLHVEGLAGVLREAAASDAPARRLPPPPVAMPSPIRERARPSPGPHPEGGSPPSPPHPRDGIRGDANALHPPQCAAPRPQMGGDNHGGLRGGHHRRRHRRGAARCTMSTGAGGGPPRGGSGVRCGVVHDAGLVRRRPATMRAGGGGGNAAGHCCQAVASLVSCPPSGPPPPSTLPPASPPRRPRIHGGQRQGGRGRQRCCSRHPRGGVEVALWKEQLQRRSGCRPLSPSPPIPAPHKPPLMTSSADTHRR